jgi:hypothetical protein
MIPVGNMKKYPFPTYFQICNHGRPCIVNRGIMNTKHILNRLDL